MASAEKIGESFCLDESHVFEVGELFESDEVPCHGSAPVAGVDDDHFEEVRDHFYPNPMVFDLSLFEDGTQGFWLSSLMKVISSHPWS